MVDVSLVAECVYEPETGNVPDAGSLFADTGCLPFPETGNDALTGSVTAGRSMSPEDVLSAVLLRRGCSSISFPETFANEELFGVPTEPWDPPVFVVASPLIL